jgi:hypothetical protein
MVLASTSNGIEFWEFLVDDYERLYFTLNEFNFEYFPKFHLNGNILALYNEKSDI